MIGCPGCGSRLVFDIASQKMKCSYCGQLYPVAQVSKKSKDADESIMENNELMQVTVFTCSQCGAEIVADSDEAVTWCSYCGSPATLQSRLSSIRRPDKVIPFKIDKEECVSRYRAIAKKQIYAPSALLKQGKAESFRGIYMPFWSYDFTRGGAYRFPGTKTETFGDEQITTKYLATGRLESHYEGLAHDASLSFEDDVSEKIVPFMQIDSVDFDECYLNGFYANAADQNEQEYRRKMLSTENDLIIAEAKKEFLDIGLQEKEAKAQLSDASAYLVETESKLAMYPVWFLSYRRGDRVSYGTVNGQTGKVYAEFPASPFKYLLFSLITAVPVFLILNFLLTAMPAFVLFVAVTCGFIVSTMFKREVKELFLKQCHISYGKKTRNIDVKVLIGSIGSCIGILAGILAYLIPIIISGFSTGGLSVESETVYLIISAIFLIFFIIRFFTMRGRYMSLTGIHLNLTNALFIVIGIISVVMFAVRPVSDWIYYVISFATAGAVAFSVTSLIHGYNMLSSVKPKQFSRSGGDDNA